MIQLTADQIFQILQQELPDRAFPQGPASAFYHTADFYSAATVYGEVYGNLAVIWANVFPLNSQELILEQEAKYLGNNLPASASIADRQNRILQQIQTPRGISRTRISAIVRQTIGATADFELVEDNCCEGSWTLDESLLDISTILGGRNGLDILGVFDLNCTYGANPPPGYTTQEWLNYRQFSYTYEVRFYNTTLTTTQKQQLDAALSKAEPARSAHVIVDGLTDADRVNNGGTDEC